MPALPRYDVTKPFMRLREHRILLNKILRDDRLQPHRRLLAFCLALWLDAQGAEDRSFMMRLMEGVWISPKKVKWSDSQDPAERPNDTLDIQTVSRIKNVFDDISKMPQTG